LSHIQKYSINGDLLWESRIIDTLFEWNQLVTADLFEDENFLIGLNVHSPNTFFPSPTDQFGKVAIYSPQVEELWETTFENTLIFDVLALDDNGFIVATKNNKINVFDSNRTLDTIISLNNSHPAHQVETFQEEQLLALTLREVFLFDENYEVINNFPLTGAQSFASFFIAENDHIFLTGKDDSFTPFVLELNENFEQVFYFTFGERDVFPSRISVNNNVIAVAGRVDTRLPFNDKKGSSKFMKTFSSDGLSTDYGEDVAVINTKINSNARFVCASDFCGGFIENIEITIQNLGLDILNTVRVNYLESPYGGKMFEDFTDLELQPNDTMVLSINRIDLLYYEFTEINNNNLCFWLSAPDNKLDHNPFNNEECQSLEIEIDPNLFNPITYPEGVFPNPTTDFININLLFPSEIGYDIIVINSIGQTVLETRADEITPHNLTTINVSKLSNGIYFVILQNKEEEIIFPFAKM